MLIFKLCSSVKMLKYFIAFCALVAAESACPNKYVELDNYCFRFSNTGEPLYWSQARTQCQAEGADLITLNDCGVYGDLVKFMHINGYEVPDGSFYWIGARDIRNEGVWLWESDESLVDLGAPFWGSDANGVHQPDNGAALDNEDCAYLDKADQYYFHDGNCLDNAYYICQTMLTNATAISEE